MLQRLLLLFFLVVAYCAPVSYGQAPIVIENLQDLTPIGKHVLILEDKKNILTPAIAINATGYKASSDDVPSLQITTSSFWVKFRVTNHSDANPLALNLSYATLDSALFYCLDSVGNIIESVPMGEFVPVHMRHYEHQDYIYDLHIPKGQTRTFLLKVSASEQILLPLSVGSIKKATESIAMKDLLFGLYAGIILVMLLYNLFLYFTVRDKSYLFYVFYILFVGLSQACLEGYAARFLYPNSFYLSNAMMVWVPALSGISSVAFVNNFMNIKHYTPKLHRVLLGIMIIYMCIFLLSFTGNYAFCTNLLQLVVVLLSATGYTVAITISRKGYRPAIFFLIAFTIFIAGVVIFVLRNFSVLPYNNFTNYAMQAGSAIEVVLLSFALADKINLFRKEKEASQRQAMAALQENERIVREQNVMLERKVNERTHELKLSNSELNRALKELKEAETQLVESEKMASLGQLTAGIAHEINNPINFVTSNVKPLNRDVRILLDAVAELEKIAGESPEKQRIISSYKEDIDFDYLKIEIDQLLNGISDGASRTAEIVKGLRIFSRLDEDVLKKADVNEGMESTLVITNNMLNNLITVERQYGNLPLLDCYPGKLNQVFLNMISNGVYAIKKKFGDKEGGKLTITTKHDQEFAYISIADNGTGMDEQTKKRIFEPFFTTKEVGEGTGLGLSIAYNTIHKHNGQIQIDSALGQGTTFTIILPLIQK
jgi:signal transduction histidine kinase